MRDAGWGMRRLRDDHASRIPHPASRHTQTLEHFVVELVVALQQAIEPSQEVSRLRPLNDSVVVGRSDRHDLRPADRADRAGRDDRALALHEARDRKSTRLNSSHTVISYAVFCLK